MTWAEMVEDVWATIDSERERRGLPMYRLAHLAGVQTYTLYRLRAGKGVRLESLMRVLGALDLTLEVTRA